MYAYSPEWAIFHKLALMWNFHELETLFRCSQETAVLEDVVYIAVFFLPTAQHIYSISEFLQHMSHAKLFYYAKLTLL